MNKQQITTLIFTIILIGLVIFMFLPQKQQLSKDARINNEITAVEKSLVGKTDPVVIHLDETPKEWVSVIASCDKDPTKNQCLYNKALDYNETSMCYAIDDAEWQGKCFRGIAINLNNIKMCNIITHDYQRNRCVNFFGMKYKDPNLCRMVEDASLQKICLQNI